MFKRICQGLILYNNNIKLIALVNLSKLKKLKNNFFFLISIFSDFPLFFEIMIFLIFIINFHLSFNSLRF